MKRRWLRPLIFTVCGAAAGFVYYHFFGCQGTCPITSNPWMTAGYLAIVGWLLSAITRKDEPKCNT